MTSLMLLTESTVSEYLTNLIHSNTCPSLNQLFPSTAATTTRPLSSSAHDTWTLNDKSNVGLTKTTYSSHDQEDTLHHGTTSTTASTTTNNIIHPKDFQVSKLHGGNMNYSYLVVHTKTNIHLFVKQAPNYVAVLGPNILPLSNQRMDYEYQAYTEWTSLFNKDSSFSSSPSSSKYVPIMYHFDSEYKIIILEFLQQYTLLDTLLRQSVDTTTSTSSYPNKKKNHHHSMIRIAQSLGTCMGIIHSTTHSSRLSSDRIQYYKETFQNRCMRNIQLKYVFTKCYQDDESTANSMGHEFLKDIEELKTLYRGDDDDDDTTTTRTNNLVLCHGDLHPGSVMIEYPTVDMDDTTSSTNIQVKIIDPEFAIYGPPGLDVGCLISGYILAAIFHMFSNPNDTSKGHHIQLDDNNDDDNKLFIGITSHPSKSGHIMILIQCIQTIWTTYRDRMIQGGIFQQEILHSIEIDTVGFALAEVCRTVLGYAGERSTWFLSLSNEIEIQNQAKKCSLEIAQRSMQQRHTIGLECIIQELNALVVVL